MHGRRKSPDDPPPNPRIPGSRSSRTAQGTADASAAEAAKGTAGKEERRLMDIAIGLIAAAVQFIVGVLGG